MLQKFVNLLGFFFILTKDRFHWLWLTFFDILHFLSSLHMRINLSVVATVGLPAWWGLLCGVLTGCLKGVRVLWLLSCWILFSSWDTHIKSTSKETFSMSINIVAYFINDVLRTLWQKWLHLSFYIKNLENAWFIWWNIQTWYFHVISWPYENKLVRFA